MSATTPFDHEYQPPSAGLVEAFGLDPDECGECGLHHPEEAR